MFFKKTVRERERKEEGEERKMGRKEEGVEEKDSPSHPTLG